MLVQEVAFFLNMCACVCTCTLACDRCVSVCEATGQLCGIVFLLPPFHEISESTQVVGLALAGAKRLYPLSQLTGPQLAFVSHLNIVIKSSAIKIVVICVSV